jgi:hypothetical protein
MLPHILTLLINVCVNFVKFKSLKNENKSFNQSPPAQIQRDSTIRTTFVTVFEVKHIVRQADNVMEKMSLSFVTLIDKLESL